MIYRFCWMALLWLGLVGGANALPQSAARALDVLVLDGVTGLPVADAPLFWLSRAEHVEKRADLEPGWKWRPEDAVVEKGRSVKLDGQGRARLQVPAGGWLLSARWKGLYGFAGVEGKLETFTLRLYPERNLTVRVLDPDGVPVPDIYAKIVAGDPEAKRKKTHARMLLDAQGRAVFGDMRHRTLGQAAASPEAFASQDLRLVLEVRGPGTVAFPIPAQAWQSGEFTAHAPALGYVMALPALDKNGDAKDQRICLWEVQPTAPDSRPSSLASLARVNGFHRAAVRLGHEFHVSAIGGDCVSAIRQRFLGPTKPRQTVTIGPFGPTDHIRVALRLKLPPDRSSHPRSRLWIGMQRMTDRGPMGRVLLNTKGLGPEPSIDLWIPEECAQYQNQALKVTYSPAGLPKRTAILPGGFGANRVLLADLTEPAGSPQASRLRPEPKPRMQRRIELHFTQPDGSDLANRSMVAQWVSLCSEPGKNPQTYSANLGRTDRWGHSVLRKPQNGEGPWQLRVHTHGNQFPVLFAQVDADPHAEHLQTIITSPLDPFVTGIVVDGRGEPLANTPLQLRKPKDAATMRGPALNVESDAEGRFEFFVLPGTEAGTLHLRGSNGLELAENVTVQRGETGVVLRAIALGAFSVEAMLPTHSRNSDLIWELVHAEGTMYAPWRGDLTKGEPFEFKELYPRTYRLRISLPKRTFGPNGPSSAQDRILYRSAPFEVLPGCRPDQVRLDAIDLRRSYRRIEVTARVEGVPTDPSQSTLLFRPTEGESLAFWSPIHVSANSGKRVLLIEPRRAIEVAARGYHHHSTLEGLDSRALLRSDVQLVGDQAWQVQLDLIPQPPVQVQFDPEALALAAPYQFHALLQSGETSPASRWIALGSEPRFEPTPVGRVGSKGTVAFPDRGFLPGERLPDTIYPALVFRPPGTEGSLQQEIDGCYRRGGSPHWSYRVAFTPNEKRIMRDSVESVVWIEFVRQAPVSTGERGALESRSNARPPLWNHPIKRLWAKGDLPLQVSLEGIQKAKQAIEDRSAPYR